MKYDEERAANAERLEETVSALLRARGATLAAAESCTGGLVAKRMTDPAGASQVFAGGVVSYTNEVKERALGVPRAMLDEYGAVSAPVARAMAEGVRTVTGARLGVSVTGVAGPDGDGWGNPVGMVYIALAGAEGTRCRLFRFGEHERGRIRSLAADGALELVRCSLTGGPLPGEDAPEEK